MPPRIRRALTPAAAFVALLGHGCHDTGDFSPSAPVFTGALLVTVSTTSIPADGFSSVDILAQITPEAEFRTVRFETSHGSFVGSETGEAQRRTVEADVDGRAVAQLKSATTVGRATVTVSVVKGQGSSEETLITRSLEVEFVALSPDTILLSASATSLPADGFSSIELVAHIDPASPPTRRTILFSTDLGVIASAEVPADLNGDARTRLTSDPDASNRQVGTARVLAKLKNFESVFKDLLIEFLPPDPSSIVRIGTSSSTAPADGETRTEVFADIAAGIPPGDRRRVTFTTTAGRFPGGTGSREERISKIADAGNRVTVLLQSDDELVEALLTATVDGTSDETILTFVRAFPDDLRVDAGEFEFSKAAKERLVRVTLSRQVGKVTPGTEVEYEILDAATRTPLDLFFREVTRSDDDEMSMAMLVAADSAFLGDAVVRASIPGSGVSGEEIIRIVM